MVLKFEDLDMSRTTQLSDFDDHNQINSPLEGSYEAEGSVAVENDIISNSNSLAAKDADTIGSTNNNDIRHHGLPPGGPRRFPSKSQSMYEGKTGNKTFESGGPKRRISKGSDISFKPTPKNDAKLEMHMHKLFRGISKDETLFQGTYVIDPFVFD
jgi:hypothetical protein